MFIKQTTRDRELSGCDRHGAQRSRGLFLVLVSTRGAVVSERAVRALLQVDDAGRLEIRAFVRHVRMTQLGHFMMGSACFGPHKLILSGAYGGDGLTKHVEREVWERCVPLPPELIDAWSKGGGHNSAGSEGPAVRAWARANLRALRAAGTERRRKVAPDLDSFGENT